MVGASKRKTRFPRRILRTILDDGTCQLQSCHEITTGNKEDTSERFYPEEFERNDNSKHHESYRQEPINYENDTRNYDKESHARKHEGDNTYYRNSDGDMYSRKYQIDLNSRKYEKDLYGKKIDGEPLSRNNFEGDSHSRNNHEIDSFPRNKFEGDPFSRGTYERDPHLRNNHEVDPLLKNNYEGDPHARNFEGDAHSRNNYEGDLHLRKYEGDPLLRNNLEGDPHMRNFIGSSAKYDVSDLSRQYEEDVNLRLFESEKPRVYTTSPSVMPEKKFNGRDANSSPVHYMSSTPEIKPTNRYYEQSGKKQYHKTGKLVGNKHQHPEPSAEFPYQCETCDMLFKSIDNLSEHQKTVHDNNRLFTCRFCGKKFNDKYNMRKHVLIHVGERRHKCQFCDKAFLRKDHLRSHLQTHYNRKYGCKSCGKGFRSIEMFERHAKTHKVEPKMEIFNENAPAPSLSDHRSMVNGKRDLRKPTNDSVHEHDNNVSQLNGNNQSFVASLSKFEINNGGNIKKEETHSKQNDSMVKEEEVAVTILDDQMEESFDWTGASPSYRSESSMLGSPSSMVLDENHTKVRKYANQHMSGYKCKACNQTFDDKIKFDDHQGECSQEKWQCRKCNVTFDEVITLKHHYDKVHSVENQQPRISCWRCKSCEITFPNSKELSRHYSQFHKDAQIYPCSECPKTFTVWHNLKKHMLIHLGDKKHKCHICDKGFVRKDHLNSHLKVHMGDGTKYNCPICSKVFRIKDMYFKHMNLHGLEKAYTVK